MLYVLKLKYKSHGCPDTKSRHSTATQSRNKFVETALAYALSYITSFTSTEIGPTLITILADTDYYSHGSSSTSTTTTTSSSRFLDFNVALTSAHKTGLGSSAALVTAFTTAVLTYYLPSGTLDIASSAGKTRLHNLSQAAHCAAQGKVGSGFDVAAAVYGSCVYRRFSPSILEGLGEIGAQSFASRLRAVVDGTGEGEGSTKKWDTEIDKSAAIMPKGIRLVMCDVDCGSETVSLVKKVLAWRKEEPEEAALLWATLQKGNEDLARELQRLALGPAPASELEKSAGYENLKNVILTIRSLIREMSAKAGVPIEPKVQTDLLDACSKVQGVVGGVVPGAGGFDAIALLVQDDDAVVQKLRTLLDTYKVDAQDGGGASIGNVRLLGVKQEMRGVVLEDPGIYSDWIK